MKFLSAAILCFLFTACGSSIDPTFESLLRKEPWVIDVDPPHNATVPGVKQISLRFSRPIDPQSIVPSSVALLELAGEQSDAVMLSEHVRNGKEQGLPHQCVLEDDRQHLRLRPESTLQSGKRYGLVVTSGVMTSDGIPLNQHPALGQRAFWSEFTVQTPQASAVPSPAETDPLADEDESEVEIASPPVPRPESLVINEILYDVTGSDTDGVVFIELFGSPPGSDLAGYHILLIDGGDGAVSKTIQLPEQSRLGDDGIFLIADARTGNSQTTQIIGADVIDNFDPQNGPDCLQLIDEGGALLDAVGYGSPLAATAANGVSCVEGTAAPDAPSDASLTRTGGVDTNDNSIDFSVQSTPTPGVL